MNTLIFGIVSHKAQTITVVDYTTPGTFSVSGGVPTGCTKIEIECYGSAGAGAGTGLPEADNKAGGAGASYAKRTLLVTTNFNVGDAISIIVAAGVTGTTGNASNGNYSSVSVTSVERCKAVGGQSAVNNTPGTGTTTGCVGDTIRAGGNGSAASVAAQGSGGGGAGPVSDGGDGGILTGGSNGGGLAGDGGAGSDRTIGSTEGGDGVQAGGGGGGAFKAVGGNTKVGGDGAPGAVRMTYYIG